MRNMDSHTVLAPKGWKVEGGAWWPNAQLFKTHPTQDIKVTAPDGAQVHIAPAISAVDFNPSPMMQRNGMRRQPEFQASNGNLTLYMPTNVNEWAQFIREKGFKMARPEAKNVQIKQVSVIPELTMILRKRFEPVIREQQRMNAQARQLGMQRWGDAMMLGAQISYEQDNQKWDELTVFGVFFMGFDAETGRQTWWSIDPAITFRAPAGQLETYLPLMMTISSSVRPTPKWAEMRAKHLAKMNQIAYKGYQDRMAIWSKTNNEIGDIIHKGWQDREKIRDSTQRKVIQTIRGTSDFRTPDGSTVELPHHYSNVYHSTNGEIILSNDPVYNPNDDPTYKDRRWETIKPVR